MEYLNQHQNNQVLQSSILQKDMLKNKQRIDDTSAAGIQVEYKSEDEWVREVGSHVSVTLIADASA
jgi:hypothetical protein